MELTRERALELHRQMWSDMQRDLGNNPYILERGQYKRQWCQEHFPSEHIRDNCFLCEYVGNTFLGVNCNYCPIEWDFNFCFNGEKTYCNMPISELLALPERKFDEVN